MKKLCRKGSVHPSPAIKSDEQLLSLLPVPVAILSLVAALSAEDREVLAYLISNSGDPNGRLNKNKNKTQKPHPPLFNCDCFTCYTSYWVRWDSSPSRQLIHQIIDAFEDTFEMTKSNTHSHTGKKDRRKRSGSGSGSGKPSSSSSSSSSSIHAAATLHSPIPTRLTDLHSSSKDFVGGGTGCSESVDERGAAEEPLSDEEKGSVGRLMSFIGHKFFGVWG